MCSFGLPDCHVKPRRLRGRLGFTRQPENSKRAHLTAPALPNTTKTTREDTQRDTKKSESEGRERKKKRDISGLPPFGAQFFLGLGPSLGAPP